MMPASRLVKPCAALLYRVIGEGQLEERSVGKGDRRQSLLALATVERDARPAVVNNLPGARRATGAWQARAMLCRARNRIIVTVGRHYHLIEALTVARSGIRKYLEQPQTIVKIALVATGKSL